MKDKYSMELKLAKGEHVITSFLGVYLTNRRVIYSGTGTYRADKDMGASVFSFRNMTNLLLPDINCVNIGSLQEEKSKPVILVALGIITVVIGIALIATGGSDSSMIGGGAVTLVIGVVFFIAYALTGTSASSTISIELKTTTDKIKSGLYTYNVKTKQESEKIYQETIANGQDFINALIEAKTRFYSKAN